MMSYIAEMLISKGKTIVKASIPDTIFYTWSIVGEVVLEMGTMWMIRFDWIIIPSLIIQNPNNSNHYTSFQM